jgi:uncharacterized protein with PQ loop repeat
MVEIDFYEICGFTAGLLFPLGLVPQIYKSYKLKDLSNISYYWQLIYMFSLSCALIYSFHNNLVPIWTSSLLELFFMCILTIMKLYYSRSNVSNNPKSQRRRSRVSSPDIVSPDFVSPDFVSPDIVSPDNP